jgi:hypothetical protein
VTRLLNTPRWPCDHFSFPSKPKPDVIDAILIDGPCPSMRGTAIYGPVSADGLTVSFDWK